MEDYLIKYCSPTLANLKAGNLFAYPCQSPDEVLFSVMMINRELNDKGVFVDALKHGQRSSLIYVYREKLLKNYLQNNSVAEFLERFGYPTTSFTDCIGFMKTRLQQSESFPHEIGIFLGYPVEDVAAFIENKGQNCLLTGSWKVYFNRNEAYKVFARYAWCNVLNSWFYQNGLTLHEIAIPTEAEALTDLSIKA